MEQPPQSMPISTLHDPRTFSPVPDVHQPTPVAIARSAPEAPFSPSPSQWTYPTPPVPQYENAQIPRVPVPQSNTWPQTQPVPGTMTAPAPGTSSFIPSQNAYTNDWSSQIFGCLDPSDLCITACICPCVVFGKTRARLRDPSLRSYDPVNQECFVWAVLSICGLNGIYQCMSRRDMRNKFNIKGDDVEDGVMSCCCTCCALVQEEKHALMEIEKVNSQGYVRPPEMQMR